MTLWLALRLMLVVLVRLRLLRLPVLLWLGRPVVV